MATDTRTRYKNLIYPLITPRERLLIWGKIRGLWKNRKPDPIQELKKIRKGWNRILPCFIYQLLAK